jgi:hypothetical protein
MNQNSIVILCDQKDCIYNKYGSMQYVCSHLHPAIQRYGKYPNFDGLFCNSKERDMTNPNKKEVVEKGTPFDEDLSKDEYKGCSSGNCDPTRKSFTECCKKW